MERRTSLHSQQRKPRFGNAVLRRQHPLTHGLIGAFLFNEGGGPFLYNVARQGHLSAPFTYTNIKWESGKDGAPGLNMNGSQSAANCPTIPGHVLFRLNRSAMSVVARAKFQGSGTFREIVENNGNTGWRYRIDNGNKVSVILNPGPIVVAGATSITHDRWISVGFSSATGTGTKVYLEGKRDGSSASVGTGSGSDTAVVIGQSSFAEPMNGTYDYLYIYDRELRESEFQLLHTDPFIMFQGVTHVLGESGFDQAVIEVTGTGELTTGINLTGTASVQINPTGTLTTSITLAGVAPIEIGTQANLFAAKKAARLKQCGHPMFTKCERLHLGDDI